VLLISSLCNDAWAQEGEYIGEGTEVALLKMADCLGFDRPRMERDFPRIGELPFESERKMMSTIHRVDEPATMEGVFSFRDSSYLLFSKGAPEIIVRLCNRIALPGGIASLTPETSSLLLAEAEGMAERGLRTLAFAYRPLKEVPEELDSSNLERELVFAGLVGMNDPPRPEVFDALNSCRSAHIEVVMITGDHAVTARAIGQELGILSPEKETLTGSELSAIPEEELERRVHRIGVYARVAPFDKVKIVKAWKARDAVVAMTGDGVNDAPALKHADIGIAMGITGTDVSKEASDMVLADDNFATIVKAVREGRIIYDNMKKFIYFLLSCNIREVITMFVAMLFTTQTPLRAVQILWINLITDGFPALALGVDTPAPGIMTRPPRDPREKILSLRKQVALLWQGMILAMGALTCFFLTRYWLKLDEASIQTAVFCTLVFSQLMHTYNCRSEEVSFWRLSFFDNRALPAAIAVSLSLQIAVIALPPLMRAFGTSRLVGSTWILIIACALAPVLLIDRIKVLIQKTRERKTGIGK
jgi:Ca2+-transporting ATPase